MRSRPSCVTARHGARPRIFQYFVASVNSASTSWPFGNRPSAPRCDQRMRMIAKHFERGQRARADHIDVVPKAVPTILDSLLVHHRRHAGDADGLAQKAAFLPMLSTRWTFAPGFSANAQATGMAGKPPPEPRSTQILASGASGRSCSESATCRVQMRGIVAVATRLVFACQRNSRSTKASSRAQCFT